MWYSQMDEMVQVHGRSRSLCQDFGREPRRRTSAFRLVRLPFSPLHSTLSDYEVFEYIRNAIKAGTITHIMNPAITKVVHLIFNYAQKTPAIL
jgi:hypothetical protein